MDLKEITMLIEDKIEEFKTETRMYTVDSYNEIPTFKNGDELRWGCVKCEHEFERLLVKILKLDEI